MAVLKASKGRDNKSVRQNRFSKVNHGKVKKLNKKFGSVPASTDLIVNGKPRNERIKSDPGHKPVTVSGRGKIKYLKKRFGATLSGGKSNASEPRANQGVKRKFNVKKPEQLEETKSKKKKKQKKESKLKDENEEKETEEAPPLTRSSDDPIPKKGTWINRQRVLVFGCRGISTRDRHLMKDLRRLMPHSRPENKMERRENLSVVNEICTMKHCNKCIMIEGRANRDVYMWLSNVPVGPSAKFLLQNIYTMQELKFSGNCLVGSRPLLSFDESFEKATHYRLMKELLTQIFGVPNHHPKSQPFFDHVFSFSIVDNRIWFRNYQILAEDGALVEIGPRFVLNPVKIFNRSFGGETIWENPHYITPAKNRQLVRKASGGKYLHRLHKKENMQSKGKEVSYKLPETDEVFTENPWETAKELVSRNTKVGGSTKQKRVRRKKKGIKQQSSSNWTVQNIAKSKKRKTKNLTRQKRPKDKKTKKA